MLISLLIKSNVIDINKKAPRVNIKRDFVLLIKHDY